MHGNLKQLISADGTVPTLSAAAMFELSLRSRGMCFVSGWLSGRSSRRRKPTKTEHG